MTTPPASGRGLAACLRDGSWLNARRVRDYPRLLLAAWLIAAAVLVATSHNGADRWGRMLGPDFLGFYAGSAEALAGRPADVYVPERHSAAEQRISGLELDGFFSWNYPPLLLLMVLPLALLPYLWALLAFLSATFAAYWAAVRAILVERAAALPALAFPGVWLTVSHGQNALLTTGLLGGGLVLLRSRPLLAGALLGLLTYKPQFGLLVPLALAVGRHWRAFGAAAVVALAANGLSAAVFGVETWQAFFASLPFTRSVLLEQGGPGWPKLQSVFAGVRMLGGGVTAAYAVQAVATLAAVLAVAYAWRHRADDGLAAAALVVATPLATPFVLDYDLTILALPIAWLARAGLDGGFRPWERTALAITWLLPFVARPEAFALGIPLTPPVLTLFLGLILARIRATEAA